MDDLWKLINQFSKRKLAYKKHQIKKFMSG